MYIKLWPISVRFLHCYNFLCLKGNYHSINFLPVDKTHKKCFIKRPKVIKAAMKESKLTLFQFNLDLVSKETPI
jgi:hypothetical protein